MFYYQRQISSNYSGNIGRQWSNLFYSFWGIYSIGNIIFLLFILDHTFSIIFKIKINFGSTCVTLKMHMIVMAILRAILKFQAGKL